MKPRNKGRETKNTYKWSFLGDSRIDSTVRYSSMLRRSRSISELEEPNPAMAIPPLQTTTNPLVFITHTYYSYIYKVFIYLKTKDEKYLFFTPYQIQIYISLKYHNIYIFIYRKNTYKILYSHKFLIYLQTLVIKKNYNSIQKNYNQTC